MALKTTRDAAQGATQQCAHRACLKLALVIPKEKGFLHKVENIHKTSDATTLGSNRFLFSGIFAYLCPG